MSSQDDKTLPCIDDATRVYRECVSAPSLSSAYLHKIGDNSLSVCSSWSQRDLERESSVKFGRTHIVMLDADSGDITGVVDPGNISELNSEQIIKWSPSGHLKAVLRQVKSKKGDEKQYIEIWNSQHKLHNVDLTALEKHGKVYEDGEFGCLEWSEDESRLLYIAEKKQPKAVSFFDKKTEKQPDDDPKAEPKVKGDQFLYRQDWGELLVGKHHPVPCILDIEKETVTIPEGLPDGVSAGQAVWTPDNSGIVFTGWQNEPYKVGLVYCRNRRCTIYHLDLGTGTCEPVSVTDQSVRSPSFNPDGSKLVYIRNPSHGPHMKCGQLMMYDWNTKETRVVVDIVQQPTEDNPFPGIYIGRLEPRCWLDNDRLICSSAWRSGKEIIVVNTATAGVTRVTNNKEFGSWTLCDLEGSIVLAFRSSPINSGQLVIGVLPGNGHEANITWKPLHEPCVNFTDIDWSVMKLQPKSYQAGDVDFEAVILQPKKDATSTVKPPLIVWPHGGPHSLFVSDYLVFCIAFCRLGFAIAQVNYRGSLGFGEASITSLPGNVGTNDVHDVHTTSEEIVKKGLADPDRIIVCGGSHGGFLATHMIGQYPDYYKVCLARNPVTNVAAMLGGSDIPAWTFTVAGYEFDFAKLPSAEVYDTMFSKSPMAHLQKVKAPTLLMIGTDDLRVPPQQGRRYHQMLKARGVKTKLLVYPDNSHPISKVDAEADCFMNMYAWIVQHL